MSEWIEWNGGKCPIAPSAKVDFRVRDGQIYLALRADDAFWDHFYGEGDVVAYRVRSTDEQTDDFQGSALIKQAVLA